MNKKNWYLGAAVLGVLLTVSFTAPAFARVLGRMYANSLHVENEPRANTSGRFTLGNDDAYIKGKLEVDGSVYLDGQNSTGRTTPWSRRRRRSRRRSRSRPTPAAVSSASTPRAT
jgi:hypothetical protein